MSMILPAEFHRRKYEQVQARVDEMGLDGLLVFDPYNVYYLSGFHHVHSERPEAVYVPRQGDPVLFMPFLESIKPPKVEGCWVKDIRTYFEYPGPVFPVAWMGCETGARRLGVDDVPISYFQHLQGKVDEVVYTDLVYKMRQVKEPVEIECIRAASKYADAVVEAARQAMKIGATELEVWKEAVEKVTQQMKEEQGEDDPSLRVGGRILSGPSSASPHGQTGRNKVKAGDVALLSMGATVAYYHSESERTFIVGQPTERQRRFFETMVNAQRVGAETLRPGLRCCDVNAKCLDVIRNAGFEKYIFHRMGHGEGLQGHESPWIEEGDKTIIQANMAFSDEPGIYVPGLGGFRHSDVLVVTQEGSESLTQYPRRLEELIIKV